MNESMPTLGQKIAKLIEESPFKNPLNFHKEIVRRFGDDAIKQRRLYFVINYRGNRKHKDEVLHQIAVSLKIKFHELAKGTTSEPPAEGPSHGTFPFGPKPNDHVAELRNLYQGIPFKPQRIKIQALGRTIEENEIISGVKCFNFVSLERGEIDLVIKHQNGKMERIALKPDEGYNFNSEELHYFENKSRQFAKVFVIRYQKPV